MIRIGLFITCLWFLLSEHSSFCLKIERTCGTLNTVIQNGRHRFRHFTSLSSQEAIVVSGSDPASHTNRLKDLREKTVFYNSLSRTKEHFSPLSNNDEVTFYSCGPTVYDYVHIGNLRTFFTNDIIKRWLQYLGYSVNHVCNLTDVDDKIINKMMIEKKSLRDVTSKYITAFFEDLQAMNILKASSYPQATHHIQDMENMISVLVQKGYAYVEHDGSVYFERQKFPTYGRLCPNMNFDSVVERSGNQEEIYKRNSADFALWKACKNPNDIGWDSQFGRGRPGWHIECSAMCCKALGESIDIHSGGIDLLFPHHSNEIAQSEAYAGKRFSRFWMHSGYVQFNTEKMSKSLGNTITLRSILKNHIDGAALRYLFSATQYRMPLNFRMDSFTAAQSAMRKIRTIYDELHRGIGDIAENIIESNIEFTVKEVKDALAAFEYCLTDDINTPRSLAAFHSLIKLARRVMDEDANAAVLTEIYAALNKMDRVFGFLYDVPLHLITTEDGNAANQEQVRTLAELRLHYKKEKNFLEADKLRKEIDSFGYIVKDTAEGFELIKKLK